MNDTKFKIGDKVRVIGFGRKFRPVGEIVEIEPPITMNGATMCGARHKVRYSGNNSAEIQDGDESGWLSAWDLERVE